MKKQLLVLLTLLLLACTVLAFTACGEGAGDPEDTSGGAVTTAPSVSPLATVTGVVYDGATIRWNAVENATAYVVLANQTEIYRGADLSYSYTNAADFVIHVYAVGDGTRYSDGALSAPVTVKYLAPVTNMQVVDGILTWDAVPGATGYRLRINGVEQDAILTEPRFEGLAQGASMSIFVKPVLTDPNSYYVSDYSNEKITNVIASPTLNFMNVSQTITWDSVQNAGGYSLKIVKDGSVIHTAALGVTAGGYSYDFNEVGEYFVSVQAAPAPDSNLDPSKFSTALRIVRLGNPTEMTTYQTESNITNVMFNDVPAASGFVVRVNGLEHALTQRNSFEYAFPSSQTEQISTITILSKGDGYTTLDAKETVSFEIVKLSVPTGLTSNGEKLMWNEVNKASGYEVFLDGNRYVCETNEMVLPQLAAGLHEVRVRARGNGTNVASSDLSTPLSLTKLTTPQRLAVLNCILSWNAVQGAENYVVYIDAKTYNTANTSIAIDPNDVAATSSIKVMAIGNGADKLNSDFSSTVIVHRLSAPENLGTTNDNLLWNAVHGASAYSLRVNDVVKNGITGTSYSWEEFSAGEKRVMVQAVGDGTVYFDSPYSAEILITKLATPALELNNGYRWGTVLYATNYQLTVDAVSQTFDSTVRSYVPVHTVAGVKTVKLRAIGNALNTVSSSWATLTHEVAPEVAPYGDDIFTVTRDGSDYTVTLTHPEQGKTYLVCVDGKDNEVTDGVYRFTKTDGGSFTIKVAVKGDGFTTTNSTYCPSKRYTVLSEVKNIALNYVEEEAYTVTWSHSNGAAYYRVSYTVYNGETVIRSNDREMTTTSFLVDLAGATKIVVSVTAVGDGATAFDALPVEKTLIPLGG